MEEWMASINAHIHVLYMSVSLLLSTWTLATITSFCLQATLTVTYSSLLPCFPRYVIRFNFLNFWLKIFDLLSTWQWPKLNLSLYFSCTVFVLSLYCLCNSPCICIVLALSLSLLLCMYVYICGCGCGCGCWCGKVHGLRGDFWDEGTVETSFWKVLQMRLDLSPLIS